METRITEVADGVQQLTTHIAEMNFGFNQYLIAGEADAVPHRNARTVLTGIRRDLNRPDRPALAIAAGEW